MNKTSPLQIDALQADGCGRVFQDTASGARSNRKGLADALEACSPGDVLTVWKLDRLGRSLLDLVGLVENLKARDVGLKVLTGAGASIDTTKPEGRLFFAMFAALAEFESELIRERTRAGMTAAKRRGRHVGRPCKLGPDHLDMAAQPIAADRDGGRFALESPGAILSKKVRPAGVRRVCGDGKEGRSPQVPER